MPNQITHPWTSEEIIFLEKNIHKLTYKEMSKLISRSPASIQSKIRYLPFQQKIKKHPVNSDFFKKWSPEMTYILGFIGADGNICHSGRAHTLHIACDDKDVIEKIKQIMKYEGPIHLKPRPNGKISYSLRICDPIIFNDLNKLGVTERKSLTFTPPKISLQLTKHFLRGYFDGDGTVYLCNLKYPSKLRVKIYTASLNMGKYLHQTLKKALGDLYKGSILTYMAHQKTPYYVTHMGHHAAVKLFDYMYTDATIYLDRKHQKFLEGMKYDA
ncbi:hypothetical protein A3J13_01985 [Candidatus Daviesbacteria bacterium RIFCSPLOWO2_02_FULL_36_8]|uniref:DOD-type homing endonuclease domain-containing protein n=1 Tax=Candidatus Daviesbacteria bacterium RIFCSPLOWO2_02_FULL_36_8 TaxID=1797793 RepID=A0A1F5MGG6_9BACT|nr:MAG: hypothetical protein A3J13_01985 [Candidatus Daviesbacteria bacterium RIFCSPLOWO2_02_FULL_36_8]